MITPGQIYRIVEEKIAGTENFIVDVLVSPGNRIVVEMDSPKGVTISDCTSVHRYIESKLNRNAAASGGGSTTRDFELIVSSPGLEEPFKILKQYQKNLGRRVRVVQKTGMVTEGELTKADESGIVITQETKEKINGKKQLLIKAISLHFDQIIKTRLIL